MEKPLHIQLLEILYKEGIGVYTNISPFFTKRFTKPLTTDTMQWREEMRRYDLFIEDLVIRGFIVNEGAVSSELSFEIMDQFKWFNEIPVMAYITSKGIDYLDQYYTNKLAKTSNYAIICNLIIAFVLGGLTVLITYKTLNIASNTLLITKDSSIDVRYLAKQIDTLSSKVQKLQQSLTLPKSKKTSPVRIPPLH